MGSIAMEEFDLLGDSKYRRALKGFESTSEWADLIAALTKLNRVLLAHMKYPIIPRRILISKRLAQCMHPDLPPGVHQKALETYDIIFKCMGTNRLSAELFIYSAGLFPLLPHAALNVRTALLTVYETHFVPLGPRLAPGLNGFLSGVLPSLEEGGEHYTRTNSLLEAVMEGVGGSVFYSAIWECVAVNTSIRLPALTFVLGHLGRRNGALETQQHVLGEDIQVICTALCSALTDSSVLVQRSALELLLQGLPLHQPQFDHSDMVSLVSSVLVTLLRRDMSLNRRLFTWLLGTEINPSLYPDCHPLANKKLCYFTTYSSELLVLALLRLLELAVPHGNVDSLDIKPFRIITVLLDKVEIGPVIIDRIMVDVFRCLHHMTSALTNVEGGDLKRQELIKTANLMFQMLETSYVWSLCGHQFKEASVRLGEEEEEEGSVGMIGAGPPSITQTCNIIVFLLETVSTYMETSSEHLPSLFKVIVSSVSENLESISPQVMSTCLSTLRKVLARVQPAWNVWDVSDKMNKSRQDSVSLETDLAREATESQPGSPVYIPRKVETETDSVKINIDDDGKDDRASVTSHELLVSDCKEMFLEMFCKLIEVRIIQNPVDSWEKLVISDKNTESESKGLEKLLNQVLTCSEVIIVNGDKCQPSDNVMSKSESEKFTDAFTLACHCILELSSMPKYNNGEANTLYAAEAVSSLPSWLCGLLIVSTLRSHTATISPIQLAAVTTVVELSSLVRDCAGKQGQPQPSESGAVVVSTQHVLSLGQLEVIMTRTEVVIKIAEILWQNLELSSVSVSCVSLLHRLISLARLGQVETVVAASLGGQDSPDHSPAHYERFARLWHLSRDLSSSRSAVDLCTLKMVSGLREGRGSVRAVCARWVEQCIARGDTGRLLEPLLLSLLDPVTSRVSVLHAGVRRVGQVFSIRCGDNMTVLHGMSDQGNRKSSSSNTSTPRFFPSLDESILQKRFPYGNSDTWVNPFALVSSESEYNQDPSVTPEPKGDSSHGSRPSSPSSESESSAASTPRHRAGTLSRAESVVTSLLTDLISRAVDTSSFVLDLNDFTFPSLETELESEEVTIHPLHSHLLLYTRAVDTRTAVWALQCLQDLCSVHPRVSVSSLATTQLQSHALPRSSRLVQLLARHRQSVYGKGFSSTVPDSSSSNRSSMLLECVLTICLFYTRSYFPKLSELSREEVMNNRELRLLAVTTLHKILSELVVIVKDNGKPFALYILDLLVRCKLQKVVLHCLLTSVYQLANMNKRETKESFTQQILSFNDGSESDKGERSRDLEAFQVELLKLVTAIVMLEEVINNKKVEEGGSKPQAAHHNSSILKYQSDLQFCCQPMFLASVLAALKQSQMRDCHRSWTGLVVSLLPVLGPATTQLVTAVAGQLWDNLEHVPRDLVTSDYVLSQLECLAQILSHCLLDPSSSHMSGVTMTSGLHTGSQLSSASHQSSVMTSLVHVLGGASHTCKQGELSEHVASARRALLSTCPRLVIALATLWSSLAGGSTVSWLIGSGKIIKTMILDLLSPLATVHSSHFLAAVSVAWAELETVKTVSQSTLVELVASVKTFPIATVISTLRQVVKSPPPVTGLSRSKMINMSALQFFSSYLSTCALSQLYESWSELRELLKDCCSLAPPSPFLALSILHQFVTRGATGHLERKEQKEVQEMTCKLVETISVIGGSKLEAGTWLRGGRSVKADLEKDPNPELCQATAALTILGKKLATLLDIVYQSEEKDRAMPLLTTVMYNTVPYLRVHSMANNHLLRAGSGLLASLSEYPFTRRAWRREGMELLLDPTFFKVDRDTLKSWRTTTDSLMSHDRTTFKELLTKIASLGQGSISLLSSKEQEQEQRALLLKRLAWVIFCSDIDQYQRQMPDITDRLSECLRTVPVSPMVQSAVFLCFRVILLRMSASHVTFLWPLIITEMVVVFSNMEQELSSCSPEFSAHLSRLSTLDTSWVAAATAGAGLGLQSTASNPAWLSVYLGVCKLLDQAVALPADILPQFQMYRWAFVREGEASVDADMSQVMNNNGPIHHDFVPHIARISKLMKTKMGRSVPPRPIIAGEPLLTMRSVSSLDELAPWFTTLSLSLTRQQTRSMSTNSSRADTSRSPLDTIERIIEIDFMEDIPNQ